LRWVIAIPVYNERKYVDRVLNRIAAYHSDLLVIDDGSSDGTADILAARKDIHLIRHEKNQGYGQSLIDAFAWATERGYDWVLTMDCDEQHEPETIPDFVREMEADDADVVSGSRYLENRMGNDLPPTDRRAINARITAVLNELFHLNLTDSFCGFKAHRVSAMQKLMLDVPGYAFPMQFWPQVVLNKLRVKEIPVRLIYNDPTRHFGGSLDDADNRLRHYLQVLQDEIDRCTAADPCFGQECFGQDCSEGDSAPAAHSTSDAVSCGCSE
jgi:glycosyltransferase involved in cell wall biosynthesis